MTKTDIIEALKAAVIFSPSNEMPCRQIQTFRVIDQGVGGVLAAENLGATICDKDRPWFWSREWVGKKNNPNKITWQFPVLAVVETSYEVNKPLAQATERCYNFNISVLDIYTQDCEKWNCKGCKGRSMNDVYEDTETLLFQAVRYLSGLVEATLPDGTTGVWHRGYLDAQKSTGVISGYTAGINYGSYLENTIKTATAYKTSIGAAGIIGNAINIQVCVKNCQAPEYTFITPDFGVLAHEAGCQTCG